MCICYCFVLLYSILVFNLVCFNKLKKLKFYFMTHSAHFYQWLYYCWYVGIGKNPLVSVIRIHPRPHNCQKSLKKTYLSPFLYVTTGFRYSLFNDVLNTFSSSVLTATEVFVKEKTPSVSRTSIDFRLIILQQDVYTTGLHCVSV